MNKEIEIAKKFLDDPCFNSLNISYQKSDDSSFLNVKRNGQDVTITYGELASLFRGLTLIKEKKQESHYDVTYHRHFRNNGWMIDVSRNATFKKESIKKVILMMSLMGMNQLMLYTEDTYEMKKYPYLVLKKMRGKMKEKRQL